MDTVFKRLRDGVNADAFQKLFDAVSDQPDMDMGYGIRDTGYGMVDATLAGTGLPSGDAQKSNWRVPLELDMEVYKWRHLIENFFCTLKEFKRIAMRSDKADSSFAAVITLVSAVINSR